MVLEQDSQEFESYVPVYDAIPETWEEGRQFLVEHLKKVSNAINVREIGFFLDEELLSGKAFLPGVIVPGNNPGQFRQILRKVIVFGPITAGANEESHGIVVDINFTLIQLWASATNITSFRSVTFSNPDTIYMDSTKIYINSDGDYDRCYAYVEYCQEL